MTKILIAFSALAIGTAAASAADLPVYTKAPPQPVVAPIYNWGGFYLGLNGGGGSAHKCWTAIAADGVPTPGGPEAEGCQQVGDAPNTAEPTAPGS